MTPKQIAHIINAAINEFDLSEWDLTHTIAELYNDFKNNEITKEELTNEIREHLSNEFGLFGETITPFVIKSILNET